MSFHVSNFGSFGNRLRTDMNGYVPTADDGPWDLDYDHAMEETHDEDGELTEYGEWWEYERFPEIVEEAIKETRIAEAAIIEWQNT